MLSWLCPGVLFVFGHDLKSYHNVSITGFTGELLFIKFLDGPFRMLGDHSIRPRGHVLQIRQECLVSAIAHGDGHVPPESGIFRTFYRRSAKCLAISFFVHLRQPAQIRMVKPLLWLKLRQGSGRRVPSFIVPWTNILADIATEYVVPNGRPELFRDCATLFNGQIGDAETRIQLARRHNGLRGAGVNAAGATSASVGSGGVCAKLQRSENHAKKQPRPHLLMDDAGVLANPSNSRMPGINALEDWASINIAAGFNWQTTVRRALPNGGLYLLETWKQRVVIILCSPGIARDPASLRVAGFHRIRLIRAVIQGANHHGSDPGRRICGGRPAALSRFRARLQVFHLAGPARVHPFDERSHR